MSRRALKGREFDWFAVDGVGHVGHFSTAGWGPVPLAILDRLDGAEADELWSLRGRMLVLPVLGTAAGHVPGVIDNWLEMARRGLFAYDWKHWCGPYCRAATPSHPVDVAAIPSELGRAVELVVWREVRFGDLQAVRPEELGGCG